MESQAETEVGKLKDDQLALCGIITAYLTGQPVAFDPPLFAVSTALKHVNCDDAFFIDVLTNLENLPEKEPEGHSYNKRIAHDAQSVRMVNSNTLALGVKYTPDFVDRFRTRIYRMGEAERNEALQSLYSEVIGMIDGRNWSPLSRFRLSEVRGVQEHIVALDPLFVYKLAGSLEAHGFKAEADTLREGQDRERQIERARTNIELRLKGLEHYHAKAAAMSRVADQDYLKHVVDSVPDDFDFGYQSPQAIAVAGIANGAHLEGIVNTKKDSFIVVSALGQISNTETLKRFADFSDTECDQYRHPLGSRTQTDAFHNFHYRRAARKRLTEIRQLAS